MKRLLLFLMFCASPSWAEIAFDSSEQLVCGAAGGCNTASTFSVDLVPVGTLKGVVAVVNHLGVSADEITGCTADGTAMAKKVFAADTSGATGSCTLFSLGASIPAGTLTIECTDSDTTGSTKQLAVVGVTAAADTEDAGIGVCEVNENAENPSCSVTGISGASYAFGGLYSGQGVPANVTAGTGLTMREQADFGADSGHMASGTAEQASGDQTIAFTATSSDVALCGLAIQEVAGAPADNTVIQTIMIQ